PKLEHSEVNKLYQLEKEAMQAYRAGDYAKAFEKLSITAPQGLKQSQFYMAYLYLKGQHVQMSMRTGMGWLGVAKESGRKEMLELFDGLYSKFNAAQQQAVDAEVEKYISEYGMQAQNVVCKKRKKVGRKRMLLECIKVPVSIEYEIHKQPNPMVLY
ncbi:MAG: hypothetical protein HKN88_10665, partial [Gammaproteobacteria bacterium]|nr:hypothetical protein [Gammaproteobacteria bacterium]